MIEILLECCWRAKFFLICNLGLHYSTFLCIDSEKRNLDVKKAPGGLEYRMSLFEIFDGAGRCTFPRSRPLRISVNDMTFSTVITERRSSILIVVVYICSFGAPDTPPIGAGCSSPAQPCTDSKYRTLDGTCNNLRYPSWGAANTKYGRLVAPKYADGTYAVQRSLLC